MNDGARENGDHGKARTDEAALSARLQRLGERLASTRACGPPSDGPGGDRAATASGYARGFRLSSELVAGVLVGAGLGWLIDRLLGTSPWGLIVLLLLGFAAGVLKVMRSAGVIPENASATARHGPGQLRRHWRSKIKMTVDPIQQFQINNLVPIMHHGRPRDRLHQLGAVHADHRRGSSRRCSSAPRRRARSCPDGCNRLPSCPTNSSPIRCAARPARRA